MTLDPKRFVPGDSLDWTEYVALVISIVATICMSVWTYRTTKQDGYFGSRVPYAALIMSMIASSSTGVSLLGKPAEAYEHGTKFFLVQFVTFVLSTTITTVLFLPTIHQLECSSLYGYFEIRFHKRVKKLVTTVYMISKFLFTSVLVLPPAIALNQISGININVGITGLALITVFYTMIGGFKGVIWTDTLQGLVMFVSMTISGLVSIYETGDFLGFLQRSYENGRFGAPALSLDPTERLSIWAYSSFFYSLASINLNQPTYQRIKCIPSIRQAKISIWFQNIGMMFFATFSLLIGLSIYVYYLGCDPKEAKIVNSYSQLVVFWVNSIGSRIRGFRGIYLAGIVCASISSISSNINSIACILESEFRSCRKDKSRIVYQRTFTAMVGIAVTAGALTMNDSSSLLELSFLSLSCDSIIAGLFLLGVLVVPAEARGAFAGGVITLLLVVCLSIFRLLSPIAKVSNVNEFMRTDQCPFNITHNDYNANKALMNETTDAPYILRLSPFSMGPLAVLMTVTIGLFVSNVWPEKNRNSYDPKLYSRFVHKYIPQNRLTGTIKLEVLLETQGK